MSRIAVLGGSSGHQTTSLWSMSCLNASMLSCIHRIKYTSQGKALAVKAGLQDLAPA